MLEPDEADYKEDLGIVTGKISLDNRFIRLFSKNYLVDQEIITKNNQVDTNNGIICLFEKLEMINNPLEYLIVLNNQTSSLKKKIIKKFSKLKNINRVNLTILFENELLINNYIIKNILMYNTLYVKLPKTNIWTTHVEWEADYFDEQMNELISIFRSFNAKEIKYTITKNSSQESNNTGGTLMCGFGCKGTSNKDIKHDTSLSYSIKYDKPIKKSDNKEEICEALYLYDEIDGMEIAKRNPNFFYFWKHPEWLQQLSHRTTGNCNEMIFTHEETINSNITRSISTALNKLDISFDTNICSLIKYTISFDITYYAAISAEVV